ncbi:hypothetical protein [Roseitranquillus sediminis]|uniref:hypothetical protein n=1 Tax=Roseitranquillus sediminis TaxID=2809051 RepID=UPI001D0C0A1B|nr:hypothetical protein [Roseitranquillus sediminis]
MPAPKVGAVTFLTVFGSFALAGQGLGQVPAGVAPAAGPRLELNYQSRFELDTNPRLEPDEQDLTFQSIHSLGIALLSETRLQNIALRFGTDLRMPQSDGSDGSLTEPTFRLTYGRAVRNAAVSLNANYRRRQIEFLEPFFLDEDEDTIIDEAGFSQSDGYLTEYGFGAALETGLERPLGMAYSLDYRARSYTDNDDPSLQDSEIYSASVTSTLRFSEISSGRVSLSTRQAEYTGTTDEREEEYRLSLGYSRALSETFEFDTSVGASRSTQEVEDAGGDASSETTGLTADFSFIKTVPDGTWFGGIDRRLSDGEFRTDLSFGRSLELRDASLRAQMGLTRGEDGEAQTTFALTYTRDLRDGAFRAAVRRGVTVDTLDEEELLTAVDMTYSKEITPLSSVSLSLDVAQIEETTADDQQDLTEAALTASLSRSITPDWDMTFGYRGRVNIEDDEDAFSNSVFVTIGRSFTFRR